MDPLMTLHGIPALAWIVIAVAGLFLINIVWQAGVLVVDRTVSAVESMTERASEAVADGFSHLGALLKGLVVIALTWAFSPVRRAYNNLTEWVISKLETEEPERAQSVDDLLRESDPFVEAREILGLQKGFTRADLDSQFRKLQRSVHPDSAGTNWLSSKVNVARDTIMKSKGWKP